MGRHSRLDDFPALRAELLKARGEGLTLDDLTALAERWFAEQGESGPPPSRSALGRYMKRVDESARMIRETNAAAIELSKVVGDSGDSVFEAMTQILQTRLFELLTATGDGSLTLTGLKDLAGTLARMQSAREKSSGIEIRRLRKEREDAAAAAHAQAKAAGLSDSVAEGIFNAVVGLGASPAEGETVPG